MTSKLDRYLGSMLGLACGDPVGTTVEFCKPGTFEPVTDMVGGGFAKLAMLDLIERLAVGLHDNAWGQIAEVK